MLACAGALLPAASALGAAAGSFTPTGEMVVARVNPAVAPLADGRVLVAGGANASSVLANAEIYNPATGTFSGVPNPMVSPRQGAGAVLLGDGRVLIAGGYNLTPSPTWLKTAEVFNPATNSFSAVGDMSIARSVPAAAPLPGGGALVIGGFDGNTVPQNKSSAEVFNPSTNTFSTTGIGSMSTARAGAAASQLADGRILVAGGRANGPNLASAELFSPGPNVFAGTGSLGTEREFPAASPLPDGRVLFSGGDSNSSNGLSSAEAFDPKSNGFSSAGIGSMTTPRGEARAAPLQDGRVLVVGGSDSALTPLKSAELFTLTPASISFRVRGKRLLVDAPVAGTVTVAGAGGKKASTAKKRGRLLKTSGVSGGPGTIRVRLRPLGAAKSRLRQKGKVRIRATLSFTSKSGSCVATFKHCYYDTSQQAKLKIKLKKK
jgi:hypothetical protein